MHCRIGAHPQDTHTVSVTQDVALGCLQCLFWCNFRVPLIPGRTCLKPDERTDQQQRLVARFKSLSGWVHAFAYVLDPRYLRAGIPEPCRDTIVDELCRFSVNRAATVTEDEVMERYREYRKFVVWAKWRAELSTSSSSSDEDMLTTLLVTNGHYCSRLPYESLAWSPRVLDHWSKSRLTHVRTLPWRKSSCTFREMPGC